MPKRVEFTVTGRGEFPFDMLRYDACYPKSSEDAIKLGKLTWREDTSVTLVGALNRPPTEGRWKSFGWTVSFVRRY